MLKSRGYWWRLAFFQIQTKENNLKKDAYQEKIAASIYQGILRYFTNEKELKVAD